MLLAPGQPENEAAAELAAALGVPVQSADAWETKLRWTTSAADTACLLSTAAVVGLAVAAAVAAGLRGVKAGDGSYKR